MFCAHKKNWLDIGLHLVRYLVEDCSHLNAGDADAEIEVGMVIPL